MPKQVPQAELDAVLQAVARFSGGASLEDIRGALAANLPRRTLQRRLALLVEQKRLTVEGRGRGSRYKISIGIEVHPLPGRLTIKGHAPQVEIYIPISPEAEVIKQAIRQPIQNRHPHPNQPLGSSSRRYSRIWIRTDFTGGIRFDATAL